MSLIVSTSQRVGLWSYTDVLNSKMNTSLKRECDVKNGIHFAMGEINFKVPRLPGVYVFWTKRFCLYVGKASNLRERLTSHWRGSHNRDLGIWIKSHGSNLCITIYEETGNLQVAEQRLIDRYRPHLNKINALVD